MVPRLLRSAIVSLTLILASFAVTSCSRSSYYSAGAGSDSSASASRSSGGSGEGAGFEGRVAYVHFDAASPCPQLGSGGKPLPNAEIIVSRASAGTTAQLVRSNCADLPAPQPISPSDLQFPAGGDLIYQGGVFKPSLPSLSLDFTSGASLPAGVAFSRASVASYRDSAGTLRTAPADAPRFDYDPVTHLPNGLLMEAPATNLAAYSQAMTNPVWTTQHATVSQSPMIAPDGTASSFALVESTETTWHALEQDVAAPYTPGSQATFSVFVKAGARSKLQVMMHDSVTFADNVYAGFDLGNGTLNYTNLAGTGSSPVGRIAAYPNGWYRVSISGIPSATRSSLQLSMYMQTDFTSIGYAGDGTSGMYVWGAQLELGSLPTSYIATSASPVARAADVAQLASLSWFNPGAGTLFAEYVDLDQGSQGSTSIFGLFGTDDSAFAQNEIALTEQGATGTGVVSSNGSIVFSPAGGPCATGVANRLAMSYSGGYFFSMNGSATSSVAGGAPPGALGYSYIGSQPDGGMRNRYVRKIQYYDSQLPASALQALSSN